MPLLLKNKKSKLNTMLQALEYRHFAKLRIINLFIVFVLVFVTFGFALFLYQGIYKTIGYLETMDEFRPQLGSEAIDFSTLDVAEAAWQKKNLSSAPTLERDPFNPAVTVESKEETAVTTTVEVTP